MNRKSSYMIQLLEHPFAICHLPVACCQCVVLAAWKYWWEKGDKPLHSSLRFWREQLLPRGWTLPVAPAAWIYRSCCTPEKKSGGDDMTIPITTRVSSMHYLRSLLCECWTKLPCASELRGPGLGHLQHQWSEDFHTSLQDEDIMREHHMIKINNHAGLQQQRNLNYTSNACLAQ